MRVQPIRWVACGLTAAFAAASGLLLVLAGAGLESARTSLLQIATVAPGWALIAAGGLLWLIVALFLLTLGARDVAVGSIAFENPHGTVTIAATAIRDYIGRLLEEYPRVKALRSRLAAASEGVEVILDVSVEADGEIPHVLSGLQDRVRQRVQDELGVDAVQSVRVNVAEIVPVAQETRSGEERPA